MSEHDAVKEKFSSERTVNKKELTDVQEKIKASTGDADKLAQLQSKMKHLEVRKQELEKQEEELRLKEKKTPWNVDTISKPAFSKTIINTQPDKPSYDDLSEEEKEVKMRDFVKDNEKALKQFGMLRKYDDSKKFLLDHANLTCESTANYLVIWCINLQMEEKGELMSHVAHQCICMQVSGAMASFALIQWILISLHRCCCCCCNSINLTVAVFIPIFPVYLGVGQAIGR